MKSNVVHMLYLRHTYVFHVYKILKTFMHFPHVHACAYTHALIACLFQLQEARSGYEGTETKPHGE